MRDLVKIFLGIALVFLLSLGYITEANAAATNSANAKASVKATLENSGLYVGNIKEIILGDNAFLVAETSKDLNNRLYAFTSGEEGNVFFIEIVTSDNKYNYDCLDLANDIKTNAKKNDKVSSMEKIKVLDMSSLIISAANIYKSLQ